MEEHKHTYTSEHERDFIDTYITEMIELEKTNSRIDSSFSGKKQHNSKPKVLQEQICRLF